MTAADASGGPVLLSFVSGLRADRDAITAGLILSGTLAASRARKRIKMLNRQIYGCASPDLLRLRVLLAD